MRTRSPCVSLTRPTVGQNLLDLTQGAGNAATSREYGRFQFESGWGDGGKGGELDEERKKSAENQKFK